MAKTPILTLRLPRDERKRLQFAADTLGVTVTDVVRDAIRTALDGYGVKLPPTDEPIQGQMTIGEMQSEILDLKRRLDI